MIGTRRSSEPRLVLMGAFLIVISMHGIVRLAGPERLGHFTLHDTHRLGSDCSRNVERAVFGLDLDWSDIKGIVGKLIHQCFTDTQRLFHQDLLCDFPAQQVRGCSLVTPGSPSACHGRLSQRRALALKQR